MNNDLNISITDSRHRNPLYSIPNLLSLSRLPLTVVLCAAISFAVWPLALGSFLVAVVTDWLDGWYARRTGQSSALGRALDPLTDKVLVGSAFIFLIPVPESRVVPWMVAVIVAREVIVTAIRGMVEAKGLAFGADWFGKLKTALQMTALTGLFLILSITALELLMPAYVVVLWLAVLATLGSGVQYIVKASRVLGS